MYFLKNVLIKTYKSLQALGHELSCNERNALPQTIIDCPKTFNSRLPWGKLIVPGQYSIQGPWMFFIGKLRVCSTVASELSAKSPPRK